MNTREQQDNALDGLINDLQVFIELSFQEDEISLSDWIKETINKLENRCWIKRQCREENCPAYENECGRCWLIAGTMCGGEPQGKFIEKYGSCTECDLYKDVIGDDRVSKLRELVIALIHSLRLRQQELKETKSELKILSGLLPTCMHCKKIRDKEGNWNQLESYISHHSEALFSHGICPDCIEKFHPHLGSSNTED